MHLWVGLILPVWLLQFLSLFFVIKLNWQWRWQVEDRHQRTQRQRTFEWWLWWGHRRSCWYRCERGTEFRWMGCISPFQTGFNNINQLFLKFELAHILLYSCQQWFQLLIIIYTYWQMSYPKHNRSKHSHNGHHYRHRKY